MYFLSSQMDAVILKMRIDELEMTTKKLRRVEKAAEREAMTVSAQEFEFMWTNRDWSERFLEYVRLAVVIVNKNDRGPLVGLPSEA